MAQAYHRRSDLRNSSASADRNSTHSKPSGASGLSNSEFDGGSRLSTVSTACTKPMAAIAQMAQKSSGLTVMARHRNGQSGAGMLSGWIAPPVAGSRRSKAGADTSARACAGAGSVSATPVGNHGGNV